MEHERLHICIACPSGVVSKNLWKHNMTCANMLHTCVFCDDILIIFSFSYLSYVDWKNVHPGCYKHIGAGSPSITRHRQCVETCICHWLFHHRLWYLNEL